MPEITRWDPFRDLSEMQETMDRLFDRGFARPWRLMSWYTGEGAFAVDLYETDADVVVKASIAGVKPEDVKISVAGDVLSIRGEVNEEHEEKKPDYHRQERRYGAFARTLALPVKVDAEKAEATFDHGVLTVRLPKVSQGGAKSIDVKPKGPEQK